MIRKFEQPRSGVVIIRDKFNRVVALPAQEDK